jgi:penicillin-binding protein 2
LNPVTVKAGLSPAEVTYIAERDRDFPGVMLVRTYLRDYEFETLGAHVLGHVGEIDEKQLARREYATLQPGDKIGQAGVEAAFDRYLRGVPAARSRRRTRRRRATTSS